MKRVICLLCALLLLGAVTLPVHAEDQGKPKLVDWFIIRDNSRDEKFADREYNMGRELTEEEYNPNATAPPPPDAREATPEEKAAYEEYLRQQEEYARESNLAEKDVRDSIMNTVFRDNPDQVRIPENSFEGDYAEYKNKDGSVTRVYDDGSVSTKYADGSAEGFDTWGNHYTADKDGKETVELTDGNTLIDNGSGYYEWHGRDGSVFTPHEDGTYSWKNASGIVIDYDADGERTAIGFEHGEKLSLDNGMFPQGDGELTGPNGASITWHNGSTYLGDRCYSFRIVGEDGRSGQAKYDPSHDFRIDEEATREKKLETNGEYKDYIMTSDTKVEISGFDGTAWDITVNNTRNELCSVLFEDEDGGVYTDRYLGDGFFQKSYVSADGEERYSVSLDGNGINAFYKDETGEHNLIRTTIDEDGNVVLTYEDGGKFVINDEAGTADYTGPGGKTIHVTTDEDGSERVDFSDPETGIRYTSVNGVITQGTGPIGGGFRLDVKDGEMEIITPKGEKVKVTEYSDGSLAATLADGTELTKDPDGNWLRDGKPLDEEAETEPPDTEVTEDTTEAVTTEPPSEDWRLTPKEVAGTYHMGCSGIRTEYVEFESVMMTQQVVVDDLEATMIVRAVSDDRVSIEISGDIAYSGEFRMNSTGSVETGDEGVSIMFLRLDDISATVFWDVGDLYAGFVGIKDPS